MGYRVMYRNPEFLDPNRELQVINTTIEIAIIIGLHPGVTYNFTIVAFNDISDSTPSITTSVTTLDEGTLLSITSMDYCIVDSYFFCFQLLRIIHRTSMQ